MKQWERHAVPEQPSELQLKPIISYPRTAEASEQYLFTIDVQLTEESPWPYAEEEFEISFLLETEPFFTHEPLGEHEPGLVLHRFGGTYGAAEYLLTAADQAVEPGKITVTLLNGWGLPIAQIELDCEVRQEKISQFAGKRTTRKITTARDEATSIPSEEKQAPDHEQQERIAKQLSLVGWKVMDARTLLQGTTQLRLLVPEGPIALRGDPPAENDYLLIIDREIIGFVKVNAEREQITGAAGSIVLSDIITEKSNLQLKMFRTESAQSQQGIPFVYYATGDETIFRNYLEPGQKGRKVYTFHQPSSLATWLQEASKSRNNLLRARLQHMPTLEQGDLVGDQFEALQYIEKSLVEGNTRTLIQFQTGMGRIHLATRYVHRLLAYANARHIFYAVNSSSSKQQVFETFQDYWLDPPFAAESRRSFTDVYKVEVIDGESGERPDRSTNVVIGTFEDLYTLYASGWEGEILPEPGQQSETANPTTSTKAYCSELPIEYFDVIILAEGSSLNYQFWQPVLDYFDALYIGITTAFWDDTMHFFNDHLVYPPASAEGQFAATVTVQDFAISTNDFYTSINKVRDLLGRDPGLKNGADRLTHMVWLLLLKYLDDFELVQEDLMGANYVPIIEEPYRWRDWAVTDGTQNGNRDLVRFINGGLIPYLSRLQRKYSNDIRNIVSTIFRSIDNRIRSNSILHEIIDTLNTIDFNSSSNLQAALQVYEELLQGTHTSRLSGGLHTPFPITRFIIDCLQPQLGETLLDPACGTAGFLAEAYQRLANDVRTPEQRQQLQHNLIGIEKRPLPYLLAAMNLLLHGIESPDLQRYNALAIDVRQFLDKEYVDIIATHPIFNEREEPGVAYNYGEIRTSSTDLLYMQLIMSILKRPGGRCGIVLPSSFLSRPGGARDIRHRLLVNFNLHTIVYLPLRGFAPDTGIPATILFFEAGERTGHSEKNPSTKEVWYYEVPLRVTPGLSSTTRPLQDRDFEGCLSWWNDRKEHRHAWKVPIEDLLARDYNLDVKNPRT